MELSYNLALILHLLCAIAFIGFVFADVIILPVMQSVVKGEDLQKIKQAISNRARKIFPLSLLLLVLTGGFMFSKYINSNLGFMQNSMQELLWLKFALAMLIVSGVVYSLSCKVLKKQPAAVMAHFHKFVLVIGLIIVILAKVMFFI